MSGTGPWSQPERSQIWVLSGDTCSCHTVTKFVAITGKSASESGDWLWLDGLVGHQVGFQFTLCARRQMLPIRLVLSCGPRQTQNSDSP